MSEQPYSSYGFFKECLQREVLGEERKLTPGRLIRRCLRKPKSRFLFFWRLASFLYFHDTRISRSVAFAINRRLIHRYQTEIDLGAKIGSGLYITHHGGIIISKFLCAGRDLTIHQNTTIGLSHGGRQPITIGDNVTIGAHCCIISDGLTIGENVIIGAMSFVNRDIPANCVYYTEKTRKIVIKEITAD